MLEKKLPPSNIWFFKQVDFFEDLTESFYDSMDRRAVLVSFKRGQAIELKNDDGEFIYLITAGQVKLRHNTEFNKEIIIDILDKGDVFGPLEQLTPLSREDSSDQIRLQPTEAVAMSEGHALQFDLEFFQSQVSKRPAIVVNVVKLLGLRQKQMEVRLTRLLFRSSLGKIAGLLSELADRYGVENADGHIQLSFKLTHQEMASVLGLKRETVSEGMAELAYREILQNESRQIIILKPEELDKIS